MSNSFKTLGFAPQLEKLIEANGFTSPTPIQMKAIPLVRQGYDLLAAAQTGTGKTAAFVLPMLQKMIEEPTLYQKRVPRVLVLTPTRELAAQVGETILSLGKDLGVRSAVVFGGVGINPQKAAIAKGLDFLVATPGRLLDLMNQGFAGLSKTHILILDEADRMLDMGFLPDLKRILKALPPDRQTLLFSATFSPEIKSSLPNSSISLSPSKSNEIRTPLLFAKRFTEFRKLINTLSFATLSSTTNGIRFWSLPEPNTAQISWFAICSKTVWLPKPFTAINLRAPERQHSESSKSTSFLFSLPLTSLPAA